MQRQLPARQRHHPAVGHNVSEHWEPRHGTMVYRVGSQCLRKRQDKPLERQRPLLHTRQSIARHRGYPKRPWPIHNSYAQSRKRHCNHTILVHNSFNRHFHPQRPISGPSGQSQRNNHRLPARQPTKRHLYSSHRHSTRHVAQKTCYQLIDTHTTGFLLKKNNFFFAIFILFLNFVA